MFVKNITMFLFMLWVNHVKANLVNLPSMKDSFTQCLATNPNNGLGYCFGVSTINRLQSLDSAPEFDLIDGISLPRDASQESRDVYDYAMQDPSDFRSVVDTFGHVFAKRAMRWDMGFLYPGLAMQVSPSFGPGGIMEFVLDPTRESLVHQVKETSTEIYRPLQATANIGGIKSNLLSVPYDRGGFEARCSVIFWKFILFLLFCFISALLEKQMGRVLARNFVLPFLLGMKFNVSTLIPIMFGLLVLIAKKAVIISKIALVLSSAFGLASLLFNNNFGGGGSYPGYHSQNYYHAPDFHPTTFGGHYNKYKEEYPEILYRGVKENADAFVEANHQGYQVQQEADKRRSRNFAWTDDEKENKSAT